jgi:hypothetical protein
MACSNVCKCTPRYLGHVDTTEKICHLGNAQQKSLESGEDDPNPSSRTHAEGP